MSKFYWIGGLLLAGAFIWGAIYVLTPENGDAEFQKAMEATEKVKSFRGLYVGSSQTSQHAERLWEVDCNRVIFHKRSQESQAGSDSMEVKEDFLMVGSDLKYTRNSDGSWYKSKYEPKLYSGSWYCDNIAQGTVRDVLPDFRAMIRSASFGKADKKTVNGVRCQDWNFKMHSANSGQKGTMCIGLDDHLPYEMTVEDAGRYTYTDYNRPLQIEAPQEVLQSASN